MVYAGVPCFTAGYTHHFQDVKTSFYNDRLVGGKNQSNGFVFAFSSVARSYFISYVFACSFSNDSIAATVGPANNTHPELGTCHYTVIDAGINFGVTVQQDLNEFFTFQLGGGLFYSRLKRDITYPRSGVIEPHLSVNGATTELLANARYELSRFFVFATYSYTFTINEFDFITHRNGFRIGVQIPFINKNSSDSNYE